MPGRNSNAARNTSPRQDYGQGGGIDFYGNNSGRKEQMIDDEDDELLRQQLNELEAGQAPIQSQERLDPVT